MKIRYLFNALMSACIVLAGCSDDILEDKVIWQEGDGIAFGARAGLELDQKSSRTVYTGETFTVGEKTYEKIHWELGDEISIYSPEARCTGDGFYSDYKVSSRNDSLNVDFATLLPVNKGDVLQWGAAPTHNFYACYPTTAKTTSADGTQSGIVLTENVQSTLHLVGRIPHNQIPTRIEKKVVDGHDVYEAKPHMSSAHMVAYGVGDRTKETVNLTFKTICTAIEIELTGGNQPTTLMSVLIGSSKDRVVGKYECDLIASNTELPVCTNIQMGEAENQVMIPLMQKSEKAEQQVLGTTLNPGDKLKLTAFLLPTVDFNDLELTLVTPTGRKSHLVSSGGQGVTFTMHKKHFVRNVRMPNTFDSSNWMSRLDGKVRIDQLSIPGSGNSYSGAYKSDSLEAKYHQTQVLDIAGQWKYGIRCFEITSDRAGEGGNGNLANVQLIGALGTTVTATVNSAVEDIYNKVSTTLGKDGTPSEFAIIIMNYQPTGKGETIAGRNSILYADQAVAYINSLIAGGKKVVRYKDGMSLQEARGGLMFVLRPSSDGEDLQDWTPTVVNKYKDAQCIIVNGWGSLHDKWKQRGYKKADNTLVTNAAISDFANSYENSMLKESVYYAFIGSTPPALNDYNLYKKGTADYTYTTNLTQDGINIWAQEWNRVIDGDVTEIIQVQQRMKKTTVYDLYAAWAPSYQEKLEDAKATFQLAVSKEHPKTLIINCLTGYFVDFTKNGLWEKRHYYVPYHQKPGYSYRNGGKYGNVVTFANRINKDFYEYMWQQWNERITAPMGVVMMNRIADGTPEENPGNFYMPGIVISNNFSFPLQQVP